MVERARLGACQVFSWGTILGMDNKSILTKFFPLKGEIVPPSGKLCQEILPLLLTIRLQTLTGS
jgi:hypothetical protein